MGLQTFQVDLDHSCWLFGHGGPGELQAWQKALNLGNENLKKKWVQRAKFWPKKKKKKERKEKKRKRLKMQKKKKKKKKIQKFKMGANRGT